MDDCSINGCTMPSRKRGWCEMHYHRWLKHGDPMAKFRRWRGEPCTPEWFWSKVAVGGPDECWPWTMQRKGKVGYGVVSVNGYPALAHRIAYLFDSGFIPDDVPFVLHCCDNPPCCNPDHLWLGTAADNYADMVAKGRAAWQ